MGDAGELVAGDCLCTGLLSSPWGALLVLGTVLSIMEVSFLCLVGATVVGLGEVIGCVGVAIGSSSVGGMASCLLASSLSAQSAHDLGSGSLGLMNMELMRGMSSVVVW